MRFQMREEVASVRPFVGPSCVTSCYNKGDNSLHHILYSIHHSSQFFPSCELPHHFVLVFEDDERLQFIAAPSEDDRDLWIESLHIASYECMKIQLGML